MVRMTRKKLADRIYLVRFKSQYELASTFLRVQEHYESRRFSGQVFSLEEFMDWYAAQHGKFSYFEDWSGFNVPSAALRPFFRGKFDPLLEKEKNLLRQFRRLREPYYIIGVSDEGSEESLTHEIAHALFTTNVDYKAAICAAMRGYDTSAMAKELLRLGYAKHVIQDEVQAYLISPSGDLGKPSRALMPLKRKLRALFRRYAKDAGLLAGT